MSSTAVILGSSRSYGNTRKVIDRLIQEDSSIDLFDLNEYHIKYYSYDSAGLDDDFIPLIKRLLEYDNLIFATPVYWYSMSAILKTFFDRITNLLKEFKGDGRKLRGKNLHSISCGSDDLLPSGFEVPFKESANYLGMTYSGHLHTYVENDKIPTVIERAILELARTL